MDSITIGHGYDTIKERSRAASIFSKYFQNQGIDKFVESTNPMERELTMSLVTSKSELADKMRIFGEVSVSYGVFSGRGKVEFLEEAKFTNTNMYLLVTSRIISRVEKLMNLPTEDEIFPGYIEGITKDFFVARYGDHYVDVIRYGGELFILFELKASSSDELELWKGELEVKMGPISGKAQFEQKTKKFSEQLSANVKIIESGNTQSTGNDDLLDLGSLIDKAEGFLNDVDGNSGYIVDFSSADYKTFGQAFFDLDPVYTAEFERFKGKAYDIYMLLDQLRANAEILEIAGNYLFFKQSNFSTGDQLKKIKAAIKDSRVIYRAFSALNTGGTDRLEELFDEVEELEERAQVIEQSMPKQEYILRSSVYVQPDKLKLGPPQNIDVKAVNYFNPLMESSNIRKSGVYLSAILFRTMGWEHPFTRRVRDNENLVNYFVDRYSYQQIRSLTLVYRDETGDPVANVTFGSDSFVPTKGVFDKTANMVVEQNCCLDDHILCIGDQGATGDSKIDRVIDKALMAATSSDDRLAFGGWDVRHMFIENTDWEKIRIINSLARLEEFAVDDQSWLEHHRNDNVGVSFADKFGQTVVTFAAIDPKWEDFGWFSNTPQSPAAPHDQTLLEMAEAPELGLELFGFHGYYKAGREGERVIDKLLPLWKRIEETP